MYALDSITVFNRLASTSSLSVVQPGKAGTRHGPYTVFVELYDP